MTEISPLLAQFADLASWPPTLWFWFMIVIGLVWLKRHFDIARGKREYSLDPHQPGIPDEDLPPLSMLVAAKDEEENIERCLRGLLRQEYPNLQVIAINDRSDDRTGAIIDEIAAEDPRLTPVHVQDLPDGWFGKNNAMRLGVEQATGNWMCFSDADCAYDSDHLLRGAMRYALDEKIDFLSVLPRLEAGSFWERVVQPVAGAVLIYWYPPQLVNSDSATHAYANGAFMLMPRATYEKLGGHEPVKATLNEDMHLARRTKQAGLRLRVIRGDRLYRVRMYVGFRQIWRGWSRIFYGCLGTLPRLLRSIVLLTVVSLSPWVTLALSPLAGSAVGWMAGAALFAIIGQQSVLWRFYSLTGNGSAWAITYPLGAAVCLGMTVGSIRKLLGMTQTTWRGTTYSGGA